MELRREATVIASAAEARRLGRYVLLGDIAEGGMGRIYLARAVGAAGFEKLFAIKVMHQGLADRNPDIGEMFLDEARINSLVRHPNVCAVHDFGDEAGVSFLVMEFMVGQTLLEVLRRAYTIDGVRDHPLFWARAARIVAEACEGLHAAHDAVDERGNPMNIVHRDISPENVFMTYNGVVKVFDFGIAKATGRRHETVAGTFKGKFAYASPEAFSRQGIDWRSDIWSMGVVLWELLAGRALFHRPSETEIFGAIAQEPIPSVQSVRPQCPPELDAIVARLLRRDREERYQDARDIARDLNRFAIKSGEHLGHGELGEWMRGLFPEEHGAAMKHGRSVARLDDGAIDRAPRLRAAPREGLVSQVIPRHDEAPRDMHSEPTVVHPDGIAPPKYAPYRSEDDEPTTRLGSPPGGPFRPPAVAGAPSPFAEAVTSEIHVGSTSDRTDQAGAAHPSSRSVGAPSPFQASTSDEERPTVEVHPRKALFGIALKVGLGVVALMGGIFLAYLVTDTPAAPTQLPTGVGGQPQEAEAPSGAGAAAGTEASPGAPVEETNQAPEPTTAPAPPPTPPTTEAATNEPSPEPVAPPRGSRPTQMRTAMRGSRAAPSMMARQPTGEPGLVNVFAVGGWADIFEGGRRLGRTPARLRLPPGRHTLTLRPSQGRTVRRVVDVPAGGTVRVRVEL
ncbi:MAG: hypothetical protein DRJ42_22050 [Deltaproteobacteria bacterium]|nr:MAG: hypothetical protein DRJ42_22050 [Deltaproteobacteria bacterium]